MVLVGVIGAGALHVAARGAVAHRFVDNEGSAVIQMRALLQRQGNGLCGTTPSITVAGQSLNLTVTCTAVTGSITMNGTTVTLAGNAASTVSLSATSAALFGGSGTMVVGE